MNFYKNISFEKYQVYFFIDDNSYASIQSDVIKTIKIQDDLCINSGFHSFTNVGRISESGVRISAWDKAIFYFSYINSSYDNIWFIEDDVFVPDLKLLETIDSDFLDCDLLSSNNTINMVGEFESWFWWFRVPESNLPLPWARSLVCAVRVSNTLIRLVARYVEDNKNAYKFIEFLFHTLSLHNELSVKAIDALRGITWRRDWAKEDLDKRTFFHPVKSIAQQNIFRAYLSNLK